MADSKTLRILLVEDDLADGQLLCQALAEIDENRQWYNWHASSIVHVEQLSDALDCLRSESFDVILLNLSLPDSPALLDSFLETNRCARGAPIVILADGDDHNLANHLLREGAQDIVVKSEIDCGPLARSLRYAIERQRRTSYAFPFQDHLTGALTRPAFLATAAHFTQLARRSRTGLLVASLEISELPVRTPEEREARELLLMHAGETLQHTFAPPALIGRWEPCRFTIISAGLAGTTVEALLYRSAAAIEHAAGNSGRPAATVRFSLTQLDPDANLQDCLGSALETPESAHARQKTVMLAD